MSTNNTVKLALSGSGFLIPAHLGFICGMMDGGLTIEEVAGTSGGSMAAAAVAVGMTRPKIENLAINTDFSPLLTLNIGTLLARKGYCSGNALLQFLEDQLGMGLVSDALIPITVMATNLNTRSAYPYPPTARLADACRGSASVPFVYAPIQDGLFTIVDGGLTDDIPESSLSPGGWRVGVDIKASTNGPITTPLQFAGACISTMLQANEAARIAWAQSEGGDIVTVDGTGMGGILNTHMTTGQRQALFDRGHLVATNLIRSRA